MGSQIDVDETSGEYPGLMKFGRLRANGVATRWSGKFKELIQDAHAKNVMPILSIGGASFGEEWVTALEDGAAVLGTKLVS